MKNTKYLVMYLHVHFIPTWYCMYMNHWYCWLIFDWQGSGDSILGVWEWEDGQSVLIEEVGDFLISGNTSLISLHVQRVKSNWILCWMHLKFLLHAKWICFFYYSASGITQGKVTSDGNFFFSLDSQVFFSYFSLEMKTNKYTHSYLYDLLAMGSIHCNRKHVTIYT